MHFLYKELFDTHTTQDTDIITHSDKLWKKLLTNVSVSVAETWPTDAS